MNRPWFNGLLGLAIVVASFSLFELTRLSVDDAKNRATAREAEEIVARQVAEAAREPHHAKFEPLLAVNADVVGWLTIEPIRLSGPVTQAEDNRFYLAHNWKREPSRAGSLFIDARNDLSSDPRHVILYGHRMRDGSMFGPLKRYLDEPFFQKHRTFQFETLNETYVAEIFSVYVTTTDVNYIQTEFADDASYAAFLRSIEERSRFATDTVLTEQDRILTLSTCDYTLDPEEGRLVVHAKLRNR